MLNPPLMYSDLWNNQRRRKWRHLNNSIYLLLFSGSVSLFSAAFHNERHLPCPFLFFIFCTAALNHKMKHIGCSVTGILWYLMYRKCRRAIHMEQSELKECQPPFCSLCWCQFWSLWSFKLCWLYYHSLISLLVQHGSILTCANYVILFFQSFDILKLFRPELSWNVVNLWFS